MPPLEVTLLSRAGCGLCVVAEQLLQSLNHGRFDLRMVDVAADPELEGRYGEAIPVILAGERELARAPISRSRLEAELDALFEAHQAR